MHFVAQAIVGALGFAASSLVGRVLLALGLSYVTYSGFDVGFQWLLDQIKTNMSGMPVDVVAFLAWLWVDKAISMIFSAMSVALTLKMAGGTNITKLVMK